jgi:hypothetical protein
MCMRKKSQSINFYFTLALAFFISLPILSHASVEKERNIYALLILDRDETNLEEMSVERLLRSVTSNVTVLKKNYRGWTSVIEQLNALPDITNDTLFVYYSGLSGWQGKNKFVGNMSKSFLWGRLVSELRKKHAALTVVISDIYGNYVPAQEPTVAGYDNDAVNTLNSLLRRHSGWIEALPSQVGSKAWGEFNIGGFFTSSLVDVVARTPGRLLDTNKDNFVSWNEVIPLISQATQEYYLTHTANIVPRQSRVPQNPVFLVNDAAITDGVLEPLPPVTQVIPPVEVNIVEPEVIASENQIVIKQVPSLNYFVQTYGDGAFVTESGFPSFVEVSGHRNNFFGRQKEVVRIKVRTPRVYERVQLVPVTVE